MPWGFYGRTEELPTVTEIISRNRWFFAKMAPQVPEDIRRTIEGQGYLVQDLNDLTAGL